jgi:hypothetical protein
MGYEKHFESMLRPLFSKDVDFRRVPSPGDELAYRVDWKIPTEDRPNKHSRPIEIFFADDFLEDYRDASKQSDRNRMDGRIEQFIKAKLAAFNPDHDFARHQPVPVERWLIGTDFVRY